MHLHSDFPQLVQLTESFDPVSLDELDRISLQNRQDTKYAFQLRHLPELLERVAPHYQILLHQSSRSTIYRNRYFDTADFSMFRDHHRGKAGRYKIRYRAYGHDGPVFLECKHKNNRSRTIKTRVAVPSIKDSLEGHENFFHKNKIPYGIDELMPSLDIQFTRLTLASKNRQDRSTIDMKMYAKRPELEAGIHFSELVIAEVKQVKSNRRNKLIRTFERMHIAPLSLSKYCMGMLHCRAGLPYNRFKEKTLRLNKLSSVIYGH